MVIVKSLILIISLGLLTHLFWNTLFWLQQFNSLFLIGGYSLLSFSFCWSLTQLCTPHKPRLTWFYFGQCCCFPGYGIASAILFSFFLMNKRNIHRFELGISSVKKKAAGTAPIKTQSTNETLRQFLSLESYFDILKSGPLDSKKKVLNHIFHTKQLDYIPIVQLALSDSHHEIKVQASSIIRQFEKTLLLQISQNEQQIMHLKGPQKLFFQLQLLRYYDQYLKSGLIKKGLIQTFFRKAATLLNTLENLPTLSPITQTKITLLKLKIWPYNPDPEAQKTFFESLLSTYPHKKSIIMPYCTLLFQEKAYEKIISICRTAQKNKSQPGPFQDVLQTWSNIKITPPC